MELIGFSLFIVYVLIEFFLFLSFLTKKKKSTEEEEESQ